jgi:hypothetical protein
MDVDDFSSAIPRGFEVVQLVQLGETLKFHSVRGEKISLNLDRKIEAVYLSDVDSDYLLGAIIGVQKCVLLTMLGQKLLVSLI